MRNLEELKIRGATLRRPTEVHIQNFESHFGVRLPQDLIALLRFKNGGSPEPATFQPQAIKEPSPHVVNRFCFLNGDKKDADGMWDSTEVWRQATGRNVIAIAQTTDDDGILLLYDNDPPSVVLCIHDEAPALIHVADSFGDFIDLLEPETALHVSVESDQPCYVGGRDLRDLKLVDPPGGYPTAADIKDFEARFRLTLPADYLTFLRFSNGGASQLNTFIPQNSGGKKSYRIDRFYFLSDIDDRDAANSLWEETSNWRGYLEKTAIPIAITTDFDPVYLCYDTQPPSVKMRRENDRLIDVANSFADFINLLTAPVKKSKKS